MMTTVIQAQNALEQDPNLEVVAEFDKSQPIGVSVSSDNRVFVSFPRREPYLMGLSEIINGKRVAYPNESWNAKKGKAGSYFVNVQDLFVDNDDQLWVLDSKPASANSVFGKDGSEESKEGQFTLFQIDLKTNKIVNQFDFKDLDKSKSALNDMRIDTDKKLAYLSDPGQASIVILDLRDGSSRSVLANTEYTLAKDSVVLSYEGKDMRDENGKPFKSNINGIALSKDNQYFYFKPINETHLYRIKTSYLADKELSEAELAKQVEDVGETVITHGLVADKLGNIYLTSSLDYSIKKLSPDGKLTTVVQDPRLIWPDSLGIGSDGYLYFSCAQVNRLPQWNGNLDMAEYPYRVYKIKIL